MTPFNLGSRHGRHLDVNLDRDLPLYTSFEPDESTVGLVMYGPDTLHGSNCHGEVYGLNGFSSIRHSQTNTQI